MSRLERVVTSAVSHSSGSPLHFVFIRNKEHATTTAMITTEFCHSLDISISYHTGYYLDRIVT